MKQDDIFSKPLKPVEPFEFNETVVNVFDDMISRSVPGYREIIHRQAQLAETFYQPNTRIYDLGCSNGNFGIRLCEEMGKKPFEMIAADNSMPMIDAYRKRLQNFSNHHRITLTCCDIQNVNIENASVVVINFTLQFLPIAERDDLVRRIYKGLIPGGILLLSEKIMHMDNALDQLQQEFYYRFKKENGYSELEISQKRDALENVLIPETIEIHRQRMTRAGFTRMDIWHKWFNFTSMIAVKKVKGQGESRQ
ncbi:MAG: carboxy-S-adenosyl-L-methionine synthase CmoA [Desulfobacterales bacterium]|nr:carboxy-S-adenosyl-L-methionine synthase CmoA [Desulfobacterales bacterium]MDD4073619.1 carboxy-S-adenosyl-L-methionine synthase CmoA [Desulfobacterales bacterium]MDD4393649.1 carboxy-S-adenosyl-L-methionine synthase CmoA [Desulfobacterales bacterium]